MVLAAKLMAAVDSLELQQVRVHTDQLLKDYAAWLGVYQCQGLAKCPRGFNYFHIFMAMSATCQ